MPHKDEFNNKAGDDRFVPEVPGSGRVVRVDDDDDIVVVDEEEEEESGDSGKTRSGMGNGDGKGGLLSISRWTESRMGWYPYTLILYARMARLAFCRKEVFIRERVEKERMQERMSE